MKTFNRLSSVLKKLMLGAVFLGFSLAAAAANLTMDKGQSRTIKTNAKIDAIFAPAPSVANYEIIDDNTFIIYATGEGKTEVTAFDDQGNPISTNMVTVNGVIKSISDEGNASVQIKDSLTNSNVSVEQVGKAYVVKGRSSSAIEQEKVTKMVAEAVGAKKEVTKTKFKYGNSEEDMPFLDKVEYEGIINDVKGPSTPQINVKLSVVEVNKDLSESLGINWANIGGSVVGGFQSVAGRALNGLNGLSASSVASGGFYGINARTFTAFVNALNNQNNARVLAEPNMSMLSGETANLLVGGEIPFISRTREETTVVYKEYGVKLLVGAKVMNNNRIRMALAQEVSYLGGTVNYEYGNVPYFNTRRSKSVFELNNGESFILGGLLSVEDVEGLSKLPVLGDIPILGAMFRNASTERRKKELVIVATVNMAHPVSPSEINYPTFNRTATLQRFFNIDPVLTSTEQREAGRFLEKGGFIQ